MLFHLGALWRLNEMGYLRKLERISSVSGGSITAGVLAVGWTELGFDAAGVGKNFASGVVDPIRALAGKTIDAPSIFSGVFGPGHVSDKIANRYREFLFGHKTLHERIPGGASGHETDKRSASSPANTLLLAKGINPDNGGADIVYHEPARGGAVFSVGSITWVPALLVDDYVSRITHNVLDRFLHE